MSVEYYINTKSGKPYCYLDGRELNFIEFNNRPMEFTAKSLYLRSESQLNKLSETEGVSLGYNISNTTLIQNISICVDVDIQDTDNGQYRFLLYKNQSIDMISPQKIQIIITEQKTETKDEPTSSWKIKDSNVFFEIMIPSKLFTDLVEDIKNGIRLLKITISANTYGPNGTIAHLIHYDKPHTSSGYTTQQHCQCIDILYESVGYGIGIPASCQGEE